MREFFLGLFGVFFLSFGVANALTPVSQYGQIQNVQTYSSNPFWNPNGPYNQRMPQPVYVQGADMNAGDCQRTVSALVANICATMNNCKDARLTDVRPTLMVQLSRLPGHNYATACSGYIDTEFEKYVKQYANTGAVMPGATFPVGTQPVQTNQPEIKNPFDAPMPQWQQEMQERAQDLEALSAASGYDPHVERASFPTTFADLSFSERMDIKAQGYEPFKDVRAYQEIKVEDQDVFKKRMANLTGAANTSGTIANEVEYCKQHPEDPACKKKENAENGLITENVPEVFEALLPWYGILVVKAGSLDKYAKMDLPIISTEYMKSHRDEFFPANSDKALGLARACTHSNHMAHDKDVINRAAHITMNEQDSFWQGNDYYVYDGQDVYWGWATIAGEVALALLTMGLSAEVAVAKNTLKISAATANSVKGASKMVSAVNLTSDATKLTKAANLAKAAKAGTGAAEVASRSDAVAALADVGISIKKGAQARSLVNVGKALEKVVSTTGRVSWTSALWKPWKLVASGAKNIKPLVASTLGRGATWTKRFKTLGVTGAAVGANSLGRELLKSFGYSSAMLQDPTTGNVEFNSFGLLSADDIEGRENVVSHGAWVSFDAVGEANDGDALNEAARFAEDFAKDVNDINKQDPLCDVDIYVVQPAISNPEKLPGKRQIYYILMTDNQPHLQVRVGKK